MLVFVHLDQWAFNDLSTSQHTRERGVQRFHGDHSISISCEDMYKSLTHYYTTNSVSKAFMKFTIMQAFGTETKHGCWPSKALPLLQFVNGTLGSRGPTGDSTSDHSAKDWYHTEESTFLPMHRHVVGKDVGLKSMYTQQLVKFHWQCQDWITTMPASFLILP